MKKKRGKKWRHIHPYTCKLCGKRRWTFFNQVAVASVCTRHTPDDPNQIKLFDSGEKTEMVK